jgi:NB-ARC domain
VKRHEEMEAIEKALLPASTTETHQNVFILHGHGGMGKTQLSLAFIKKHHQKFSSVFWLDGSTHKSVQHSLVDIAPRLPKGHISERSLSFNFDRPGDLQAVIEEVLGWFERPANRHWLIVFDNVDRDFALGDKDLDAFDVARYFPGADHGTILITSRLPKFQQYGRNHSDRKPHLEVGSVTDEQGENILASRVERPLQGKQTSRAISVRCI